MDQPKIERMLRVMQYFSSNTNYTLDEIGRYLGLSRRSLFRYIDSFKRAGFSVTRVREGVYQLTSYNKEYSDFSQLVYFSEDEAIILANLIENLSGTNALKEGLRRKLSAVCDATSIGDYFDHKGNAEIVDTLRRAIQGKVQVALKDYASAHSGKKKDYVLEPYKFTKDLVSVIAYDTAAGMNKMFKVARIGQVSLLGPWAYEASHEDTPIDAFMMSGEGHPIEHVKLKLTLRAKNLLTEEYPVTGEQVYQVKRTWFWEGEINAFEGIGRFVLGLYDEISVEEGEQLKAWLREQGSRINSKFRK